MPYKNYEQQQENARQYYISNKEKKLAQATEYYYKNWKEKQAYRSKWIKDNPDSVAKSKKKYAEKINANPATKQKNRAYNKVRWALQTGTLIRPDNCQKCKIKHNKIDAHHPKGYNDEYALTIMWLCKLCHEREHHHVKEYIKQFKG